MDQTITLFFNGSSSLYLDGVAWYATQMSTWLPLLIVTAFVVFREHDFSQMLFLLVATLLCVIVCDQVASTIFKPLVARWRPTHDPYIMGIVDTVNGYRGGSYGFFSSHAANTFTIATFISLVFRRSSVTYSLFAWALLCCWTRVYLGAHYVGDIFVGSLFGIVVALLAYRIYLSYFPLARVRVYHQHLVQLIPLTFVVTLCIITIPWRLFF